MIRVRIQFGNSRISKHTPQLIGWSRVEKNASRSMVEKSKSQPMSDRVKSNISSLLPTLTLAGWMSSWREEFWKTGGIAGCPPGKVSPTKNSGIGDGLLAIGSIPCSSPEFWFLVSGGIHSYEGLIFLRIVWILTMIDWIGSPGRMDERQCSVVCIHGRCVGARFSPCMRSYIRAKQALLKK